MTVSNLLSTNVVVSILGSVYNHKHRADYTTIHYMVHATRYTLQTQSPKWFLFSYILAKMLLSISTGIILVVMTYRPICPKNSYLLSKSSAGALYKIISTLNYSVCNMHNVNGSLISEVVMLLSWYTPLP